MKNKTILQTPEYWAMKLKNPELRYRALYNLTMYPLWEQSSLYKSLFDTILGGFSWVSTPEGSNYWRNLTCHL